MGKLQNVLGRNLKRLRALRGDISQRNMARIAGVSQKTISNLEVPDGAISPRLVTIEEVADYFDIHPSILLMEDVTDDALTDREVSKMVVAFAQLPSKRKRQILDLIDDFSKIDQKTES